MDPISMGLMGVQGAMGIAQGIKGMIDMNKLKGQRPDLAVTDAVKQNLSAARAAEREGLAAATVNRAQQQIDRQTGAALSASGDRMGGLAGLGGVSDAANQGLMNILSADASARQAARQQTMAARSALSQEQQRVQNDKLKWYNDQLASTHDMMGAGIQNFGGALGGAATMANNAYTTKLGNNVK